MPLASLTAPLMQSISIPVRGHISSSFSLSFLPISLVRLELNGDNLSSLLLVPNCSLRHGQSIACVDTPPGAGAMSQRVQRISFPFSATAKIR